MYGPQINPGSGPRPRKPNPAHGEGEGAREVEEDEEDEAAEPGASVYTPSHGTGSVGTLAEQKARAEKKSREARRPPRAGHPPSRLPAQHARESGRTKVRASGAVQHREMVAWETAARHGRREELERINSLLRPVEIETNSQNLGSNAATLAPVGGLSAQGVGPGLSTIPTPRRDPARGCES
jgi:hypothetical protein